VRTALDRHARRGDNGAVRTPNPHREARLPSITHMLETALYVDDIERATAFYRDVLGLSVMSAGPRMASIDAGAATVLLSLGVTWLLGDGSALRPVPLYPRVLLLTRTAAYAYLNKVIVAEVTSTIRSIPQEVSVGKREGLSNASVVNLDNVHVIPKSSLGERLGHIDSARVREVKRALGYALDWYELKVL